ncbi:MAG TPA: glycosyltransferase family 2 protein [Thermoanaerobaculia bacterium]|nr:glycosyltransferase family 2 protein [Thermoanaerobaculia bacterium]
MTAPHVSIVVPVFNEERSLPDLVREIGQAMAPLPWSYEVVFVDDGSTDRSREVLHELAARDGRLRVAALPEHRGQSAALAGGFRLARGGVVVTLDADLQNDPADVPLLFAALEGPTALYSDGSGVAVVSGVRRQRQDDWLRRVSSRVANAARRAVLDDGVTDVGCSLNAYRAEYLRQVPAFDGFHRFLPALIQMAGGIVREVDVGHRPRIHGTSKYGVHDRLWRGIVDLLGVRWMQRRWIDPGAAREELPCPSTSSGWQSASSDKPSSPLVSSSSGSPPSAAGRA